MAKKKAKTKSKSAELPDLAPSRELTGKPCASCLAVPDVAIKMVEHGWHAVGVSEDQYIMIGDPDAVASYLEATGGSDDG